MSGKEQTKKPEKKEKKLDKKQELDKFVEKNDGIEFDTKDESIRLTDGGIVVIERKGHTTEKYAVVPITDLTDVINFLRRVRTLLKKLGYKTSTRQGKYI